jgi:ribonuclease VapC
MTNHDAVVLDASALLAYLFSEPGADNVREALKHGAHISALSYAEVLSKLADAGHRVDESVRLLQDQGLAGSAFQIVPLDARQAEEIARLSTKARNNGLSLGGRACLALGHTLKLHVLTTDKAWEKIKAGIHIEILR